jgi:murein DD-endopeptidase MepM/ murein hydrolase activator NlpD
MRKVMLIAFLFAMTRIQASGSKEIITHEVKPHETVFKISLIYNSTVEDIVAANPKITNYKIRIGETVKVPKDTKIRDAAFVQALLSGKKPGAIDPNNVADLAHAQLAEDALLEENPFMSAPKQRKSIEQIEKESALENNVPKKAFAPSAAEMKASTEPVPKTDKQKEKAQSVSLFDQQIDELIREEDKRAEMIKTKQAEDPSPAAEPTAKDCNTPPATAVSAEPIKIVANEDTVQTSENNTEKIGVAENRNVEILKQLGLPIDANQVIAINLQIVMKDGSVRTISSHEGQKKILAQFAMNSSGY